MEKQRERDTIHDIVSQTQLGNFFLAWIIEPWMNEYNFIYLYESKEWKYPLEGYFIGLTNGHYFLKSFSQMSGN